jgi:hypothetical protein
MDAARAGVIADVPAGAAMWVTHAELKVATLRQVDRG